MGVHATFRQLVAGLQYLAVLYLDTGAVGNQVYLGLAVLACHLNLALLLGIQNGNGSSNLRDDCKSLRLSGLKKLLDTGKTLCDISTCDTAAVEGSHGQLCTRLTDRLSSDDTNCLTYLYSFAGCHVRAVALRAHTGV